MDENGRISLEAIQINQLALELSEEEAEIRAQFGETRCPRLMIEITVPRSLLDAAQRQCSGDFRTAPKPVASNREDDELIVLIGTLSELGAGRFERWHESPAEHIGGNVSGDNESGL